MATGLGEYFMAGDGDSQLAAQRHTTCLSCVEPRLRRQSRAIFPRGPAAALLGRRRGPFP